jgi:hypothetical protein
MQQSPILAKAGRIALVAILGFLLTVQPVHAKNGKLAVTGALVMLGGVVTAVVGGNPREKSDQERLGDYSSCYNNDGMIDWRVREYCFEQNYEEPLSGIAWSPNGKVIGVGLLIAAVGTFMLYKGLTGPSVVVAPQQDGVKVTVTHGW